MLAVTAMLYFFTVYLSVNNEECALNQETDYVLFTGMCCSVRCTKLIACDQEFHCLA